MAWRPTDWVLEGELDNTTLGWTIGWVRLLGREEPLRLKLAGNCHPDLAGWKFRIVHRAELCKTYRGHRHKFNPFVFPNSGARGVPFSWRRRNWR